MNYKLGGEGGWIVGNKKTIRHGGCLHALSFKTGVCGSLFAVVFVLYVEPIEQGGTAYDGYQR